MHVFAVFSGYPAPHNGGGFRPKAAPFVEAAEGRLLYGGWVGSKYSKHMH